jgi:Protein of unknown function (DUF2586)
MAASQPQITFIEGQGGLGRPLDNKDHVSGLVFYTATLPSGFTSTARQKTFYQPQDAINAGIQKDYSDATSATGTYLITALGATGNTIELKVADANKTTGANQSTSLGVYTKTALDTTIAIMGANIAALINSGTSTHGYTATFATATITLIAPKNQGIFLNSGTPISAVIVGTIAGTITQFTGGVASLQAVWYYHIAEFFRINPKGYLHVGFYAIPTVYDFAEVTLLQNFAIGEIRQVGVFKDAVYSTTDITALNAACNTNKLAKKPLIALYAANIQAVTSIATLTDLAVLNSQNVTNVIGQDAGGVGNFLYRTNGKSISCLGTELGIVSLRKVSESIAWVEQSNVSNGLECETIGFANGQLFNDIAEATLNVLNNFRHTFLRKFVGYAGSFFNDSHACISEASDYAQIENNRTLQKAERVLYAAFMPKLNSPITFNRNGTLDDVTIGNAALDTMIVNAELSVRNVFINPTQNVLATSKLIITATLVINGVARQIEVPIGFKPSV